MSNLKAEEVEAAILNVMYDGSSFEDVWKGLTAAVCDVLVYTFPSGGGAELLRDLADRLEHEQLGFPEGRS